MLVYRNVTPNLGVMLDVDRCAWCRLPVGHPECRCSDFAVAFDWKAEDDLDAPTIPELSDADRQAALHAHEPYA